MRPRWHLLAAAGLAALLAAGACGNDSTGVGGAGLDRPTGAGEVVVQVMVDGGFVPPEVALATVPARTVLGDGTVVTPAPTPAIYPGPALAPLQAVKVSSATVDGLVARAAKLGLLAGPLQFGQPPVADAPNTTVTIAAGGRTHRHVAAALGIADEGTGGPTAGRSRTSSPPSSSCRRATGRGSRAPSPSGSSARTSPTRNCRSLPWHGLWPGSQVMAGP